MDGRTGAAPPTADPFAAGSDDAADGYGPEVRATFDSECAALPCLVGGLITEGDGIRAAGDGEWVHTECADD